jgi:hypothetical protein
LQDATNRLKVKLQGVKTTVLLTAILVSGVLADTREVQAQFLYTTNDGTITITGYTGSGGAVLIPGTLDGFPVTTIGDSAFRQRDLTSVTIPNSVLTLGDRAFFGCTNLASVTLGNSVTAIQDWAFSRCYSLTGITFPASVTTIGEGAFYLCTGLTNVTIPDSVVSVDDWAFAWCAYLAQVTFGNGLSRIDDRTFSHCFSLTSVTIPDGVKSIGTKAFSSCYSLTNVVIGNGVTKIESWVFSDCYSLTEVTIGKRLRSIGDWAFYLCANLKAVNFRGDTPTLSNSGVFAGADSATIYYLPGTTGWGPTFDGLPTALWSLPQPVILDFGAGFGVATNSFNFVISWATNLAVVVEASATLNGSAWSPVATNSLTDGWAYFSDPEWSNSPTRYYRARAQ